MTKSIVLFGYRCTGKTEKGKMIAGQLDFDFLDADNLTTTMLAAKGYANINELVEIRGWPEFRRYENAALEKITRENDSKPIVLALGGGAVANTHHEGYRLANIELIRNFGISFYLLPFEDLEKTAGILARRQIDDPRSKETRPDLGPHPTQNADYDKLAAKNLTELTIRDPMYRAAADYVILTQDKPQEEVAKEIVELYLAHR